LIFKKSDSYIWQFEIKSYNQWMRLLSLFLFGLIPALVLASPAEEPENYSIPILDSAQNLFGRNVNTVANRLDLFFADQRADDELARSRLRIRQNYQVRERALLTDDFQVSFNIRLPHLEEKFKFELESSRKKREEKKKEAKAGETSDLAQNELNKNWQFRADVGVNASIPPKVFSRARLRKNMTSWKVIHRFVEEVAWYSDRDWEEQTTLDSDLSLAEDILLRFRNTSDWKITRKDFKTSHGPVILQRLSDDGAVSYGVNLSTIVDESWYVDNYRISITYRRNLYKHWLYADLTPGLDFPKFWSFRRTPFIALQLEALFGGI
jgi:hypothetical protein